MIAISFTMYKSLILVIFSLFFVGGNCICNDPNDWENAYICSEVFNSLKQALIEDEGNLYRMKKAFYYAPRADPVLIQVNYNISYSENITDSDIFLPYCGNVTNNVSAISTNETQITRGWTSRGVYFVINPLALNNMQMALPFAILRLINRNSDNRSPEVDTFLWDGSYDLPTLFINLFITSLPCIPSEDIFNSTLDDLNAYLKTYATSQGSVSNIHGDDIAYTLSEERILYPDLDTTDISIYFIFYCLLGLFILFVSLMNVFVSKRLHLIASLSSKLHDHKELAISTILLGYILIVFEFIAMSFYFSDLSTFANLRLYLWMVTTVSFIYVLYLLVKGCITFKKASKEDRIKLLIITTVKLFGVIAVLFYFYLYCYALPTFLLLLIHPTKVIAVVAYLIAFIFATSAIISVYLRFIIVASTSGFGKFLCCSMVTNGVIMLILPFFSSIFLFQFLYALVLSEASAITAGPYTILSLIPSAAVSVAIWMIKNKVFSDTESPTSNEENTTEGNKTQNENSIENETQSTDDQSLLSSNEANDGQRLTLVVNADSPNGNNRDQRSYGTVDDNK